MLFIAVSYFAYEAGDSEEAFLVEADSIGQAHDKLDRDEVTIWAVNNMLVLGYPTASRGWVILGLYHEYHSWSDPEVEQVDYRGQSLSENPFVQGAPEIAGLIFADNREQALELLKYHPSYQHDLQDILKQWQEEPGPYEPADFVNMPVLEYIFGGEGVNLFQLAGGFAELTAEQLKIVKAELLTQH